VIENGVLSGGSCHDPEMESATLSRSGDFGADCEIVYVGSETYHASSC